jgi:Na+/H+-dicarboxylate symporter/ABC-type amino acid transport substrate-binding protein
VTAAAPQIQTPAPPRAPALSLSAQIIIGLALGIAVGLFFGEPASVLQPLADIYIRLIQMTVLPYLVITLVVGLGELEPAQARRIGLYGVGAMLTVAAAAMLVIAVMPFAFPPQENAFFFSHAVVEPRQSLGLIDVYVPSNPFNALANSVIPAVVLFSSAVGLALIGLENRQSLLAGLRTLEKAIVRITNFVIRTTPFGVFAIAAVTAGTMDLATLQRLEAYFASFVVASLLLCFVILPGLVKAFTPFSYRQVVGIAKDALLTAFVAQSVFIVLPIIVERVEDLLEKHGMRTPESVSTVRVLVPMAFIVPNAGRLLTLLFVLYGAWLAGTPLQPADYGSLFGAGFFAYFAKAQVALPFLMDLVGIPHDFFQLYIPTTIVTGKFDSMVSAMSLLAVALCAAAAAGGRCHVTALRVLVLAGTLGAVLLAAVVGTRLLLAATIDTTYRKAELLTSMHLPRGPISAIVRDDGVEPETSQLPALERIRARGSLRVGYVPDRLPFTFVNARHELVGLDVELAGRLAEDIGVPQLEFVPARRSTLAQLLADRRVDVVMNFPYLRKVLSTARLSAPYFDADVGFVVKDARRHDFATLDSIRRLGTVTLGLPVRDTSIELGLREYLHGVDVRFEELGSPYEFLVGWRDDVDAFVTFAASGAAWSLLHPEYSVVVPQPRPAPLPVAVGMRPDDRDLHAFVDNWLVVERSSGSLQRAYDYWVLGKGVESAGRRWSVMRDVLGWGR